MKCNTAQHSVPFFMCMERLKSLLCGEKHMETISLSYVVPSEAELSGTL